MATLNARVSRLEQMTNQPKPDAEKLSSQGFSDLIEEALKKVLATVRTPKTPEQHKKEALELIAHWKTRFGW